MYKHALYNHLELCTHLYNGNIQKALETCRYTIKKAVLTTANEKKKYLCSLNLGIYNFILLKDEIALTDCCHKNMDLIFQTMCTDVTKASEKIILTYANCKDYLIEKHKNDHIKQAIQYIHNHLSEPLSLEIVSDRVGLNKCYLSKLFKEEVGCPFSEYIKRRRVHLAKQLLKKSDLTLPMIAEACGFQSDSYLCACFKKEIGVSPCKYRRTNH